jgi:hypothetical protein
MQIASHLLVFVCKKPLTIYNCPYFFYEIERDKDIIPKKISDSKKPIPSGQKRRIFLSKKSTNMEKNSKIAETKLCAAETCVTVYNKTSKVLDVVIVATAVTVVFVGILRALRSR